MLGPARPLLRVCPLGVLAFVVSVAYWPGILGQTTTPRWVALAIGLALVSRLDPRKVEPKILCLLSLGLAWAAVGLAWTPDRLAGMLQLFYFGTFGLAFIAAAGEADFDGIMTGFALGIGVSSTLAIPQVFGWSPVVEFNVPAGLFFNREILAELAAPVAVWAVLRRSPLAVLPLLPLALCQSRVGVLSAALGLLYAWKARTRTKVLALSILAVAASASILWLGPGKLYSGEERMAIWRAAAAGMTLFGRGIGWFQHAHPLYDTAHSDGLQAFAEFGVGALFWLAIPALIFWRKRGSDVERAVLAAACVEAAVSFPLHTPTTGFLGAVVAGFLARARPRLFLGQSVCRNDPGASVRWEEYAFRDYR